ncbi:MAG: hypothetical protein ACPHX8_08265, partial [Candidatus Poseidoniaceae archaeon]
VTTLERVMVITEIACNELIAEAAANTDADFDVHWDSTESVCFGWVAFENASHPNENHVYDLQDEEVCYFKGLDHEFCFPIKVSGRVMWFDSMGNSIMGSDGSSDGANPGHCGIYIESEQLTLPGPIIIGEETINQTTLDWNQSVLDLMADQQYIDWDLDRMNAYAQESSNAPSWCTAPVFSEYWWASQLAESNNPDPGNPISVTVNDHADAITTDGNDNLFLLNLDSADANISIGNLGIELEDGDGNVHELAGNILIGSQSGTDDSWWEIGETITLIENGVDISGDGSTQSTFTVRVIDGSTTYHIGQFTLA